MLPKMLGSYGDERSPIPLLAPSWPSSEEAYHVGYRQLV